MNNIESEIEAMVDLETRAWNTQDAELLVSVFHPDMVWPWPETNRDHNPEKWIFLMGRYDRKRWRDSWQSLFNDFRLVHNKRDLISIVVSKEGDGAFAVVDVDTLWEHKVTGQRDHWKGRACKIYTKMDEGWKLISHTGLLEY